MDSPPPLDAIDAGINEVICKITGQPAARHAQIASLRRLVYEKHDTILIAATGFGKSAVLFAFWLLTNKVTILIVLLARASARRAVLGPLSLHQDFRKAAYCTGNGCSSSR